MKKIKLIILCLFLMIVGGFVWQKNAVNLPIEEKNTKQINLSVLLGQPQGAQAGVAIPAPDCMSGIEDLPSSNYYKINVPWSLDFVRFGRYGKDTGSYVSSFMDINGDGLLDYVYSKHEGVATFDPGMTNYSDNNHKISDCVYLNNGNGWNMVYRCRSYYNSSLGKNVYYGDCAEFGPVNPSNPPIESNGCINYPNKLKSSSSYNPNAAWFTGFTVNIPESESSNNVIEIDNWLDINGDGLLDYISINHRIYQYGNAVYRGSTDCVYLNNGNGWQPAYRCNVSYPISEPSWAIYYGDCAL